MKGRETIVLANGSVIHFLSRAGEAPDKLVGYDYELAFSERTLYVEEITTSAGHIVLVDGEDKVQGLFVRGEEGKELVKETYHKLIVSLARDLQATRAIAVALQQDVQPPVSDKLAEIAANSPYDNPGRMVIETNDKKYAIVFSEIGAVEGFLRHGEPWPAADDWKHAKMISTLFYDLHETRRKLYQATLGSIQVTIAPKPDPLVKLGDVETRFDRATIKHMFNLTEDELQTYENILVHVMWRKNTDGDFIGAQYLEPETVVALVRGAEIQKEIDAREAAKPEPEIQDANGLARKAHYGDGRQPWDDIKVLGWAPAFAAGNVLKYIRRHAKKNGADDISKARWYYARLLEGCEMPTHDTGRWEFLLYDEAMRKLKSTLTDDECMLLANVKAGDGF